MSSHTFRRLTRRLKVASLLIATTALAGCSQLGLNWGSKAEKPRAGDTPYYSTASIPAAPTVESGVAAWDGDVSAPGRTAGHPTLPIGAWVRVTNARTAQSTVVQVTRRLTDARDRDIELSRDAAVAVGALHEGFATVLIEPIDPRQATPNERLAANTATPRRTYRATPTTNRGYNPNIATASIPRQQLAASSAALGPRYLQVGAFRDLGNAHRALAAIQSQGLTSGAYGDGFIQTAYVDGAVFHRVRLGPIENGALAEQALQEAKTAGHPGAQILKP